jgi:tetratricopeptide (TPR) repeat protein
VKHALLLLLCAACARSLHESPRIEAVAQAPVAEPDRLLAAAGEAWNRRTDPGQAATAEDLYSQAARADPKRVEAYAGAIRAKAFRIGREKNPDERRRLAEGGVILGQLCEENAPGAAPCDYWLAAALGLQARERSSTGKDALPRMTDLLRRAIQSDPKLDHAGPHRLLAIVLLRAPAWPLGPGDPDAALPEAEAAARMDPEYAPNQLALGEALKKKGREQESRAAYSRALDLALQAAGRGEPDAGGWLDDARAALGTRVG